MVAGIFSRITAVISFMVAVACAVWSASVLRAPDLSPSNLAQESEFDQAIMAVVHEPTYELFLSALHPEGHLFEQPVHVPESVEHHRNLQRALQKQGVSVFKVLVNRMIRLAAYVISCEQVRDVLVDGANANRAFREKLENEAMGALSFVYHGDISRLSSEDLYFLSAEYKQSIVRRLSSNGLVDVLLNQPSVVLADSRVNAHFVADHVVVRIGTGL